MAGCCSLLLISSVSTIRAAVEKRTLWSDWWQAVWLIGLPTTFLPWLGSDLKSSKEKSHPVLAWKICTLDKKLLIEYEFWPLWPLALELRSCHQGAQRLEVDTGFGLWSWKGRVPPACLSPVLQDGEIGKHVTNRIIIPNPPLNLHWNFYMKRYFISGYSSSRRAARATGKEKHEQDNKCKHHRMTCAGRSTCTNLWNSILIYIISLNLTFGGKLQTNIFVFWKPCGIWMLWCGVLGKWGLLVSAA